MLYFSGIQYKDHSFVFCIGMSCGFVREWSDSNVFICGTVRNCEPYLDAVFANIKLVTELFADYRIIIAFDVSDDASLDKLKHHQNAHGNKMHIHVNQNPRSSRITENISNARNECLTKMRELTDAGYTAKYFIMIDMDNVCAVPMNIGVFKRTMNLSDKWDSVSFNRLGYYDAWALSIDAYIYSCWGWWSPHEVIDHMRDYVRDKLNNTPAGEFAECRSAFNGFAIYKTALFLDCHYDWRMPKQYMKLEDLLEQQRILWGVGSIRPLDEQTDEPDCEHRAFHMMATAKNGARIRISPECLF